MIKRFHSFVPSTTHQNTSSLPPQHKTTQHTFFATSSNLFFPISKEIFASKREMSNYWMAAARSNKDLLDQLKKYNVVQSKRVEVAMRQTDRGHYSKIKEEAYNDTPHPIGWGATISAPHMHAKALELMEDHLKPGAKVLDVGSGSGYLCSCLSRMIGNTGKVIGIDVIPELVDWSVENVKKDDPDLLTSGRIALKAGDGWKGDPENAPFDAIHVGAAAQSIPKALTDQLKEGGRMIIPVGVNEQWLMQVDKEKDGSISKKKIFEVRYVPLVKKDQPQS